MYVYCVRELGLDINKVNVNGGAIALGHPLDTFSSDSRGFSKLTLVAPYVVQVQDRLQQALMLSHDEMERCMHFLYGCALRQVDRISDSCHVYVHWDWDGSCSSVC